MSEKKPKKYMRGNAKEKQFASGDPLINFSFNINKFLSQHEGGVADLADEDGWVQCVMAPKRETDQYGNTHSMWLNEWKPDPDWTPSAGRPSPSAPEDDDSAPF
jgi:hypothetical protein